MSTTPYASVAEVRQRIAAVVEALLGFREVPWPLSPAAAPAGYDTYPFAIVVAKTENTGRYRGDADSGIRVRSTVVVQFLAAVTPAEGEELSSLDTAMDAEASVIRAVLKRGEPWAFNLAIEYLATDRGITEDGAALVLDPTFTVDHVVRLA